MTKNTDNNISNIKQHEIIGIIEIAYKKSLKPTIIFTELHYIIVPKLSHKKFIQGIKRSNIQEFL
jgi:hypothetical protein